MWGCRIEKAIARKEAEIIISIHSQAEEGRGPAPFIHDPSSDSTLRPNFRIEVTASSHSLFPFERPFERHGISANGSLIFKISGRS